MCGIQRVKPVSLPVGGRAGSSWGTKGVPGSSWLQAPAGSSLDLPGSSTTPRNWHLGDGGALDRWHLRPLVT